MRGSWVRASCELALRVRVSYQRRAVPFCRVASRQRRAVSVAPCRRVASECERCARVMYACAHILGWWFSSGGARGWPRAGSRASYVMDASASVQGVAVAVGVALATRRGTLCVQRKTRRSRWLKVSAGLLVLTAPILILLVCFSTLARV